MTIMANNIQELELTWIGKESRPQLEPRILLEDPERSYHGKTHRQPTHRGAAIDKGQLLLDFAYSLIYLCIFPHLLCESGYRLGNGRDRDTEKLSDFIVRMYCILAICPLSMAGPYAPMAAWSYFRAPSLIMSSSKTFPST